MNLNGQTILNVAAHLAITACLAAGATACVVDDPELPEVSRCGNGMLEPGEDCDGAAIHPELNACYLIDPTMPFGVPTCTATCRLDLRTCAAGDEQGGRLGDGYCGNGLIETGLGEECDLDVPETLTCERQLGAGATGEVRCGSDCKADTTGCCLTPGDCGNDTAAAPTPTCSLGHSRCVDVYREQECYPTSEGQTSWGPIEACAVGEVCDDGEGCHQGDDPCLEGALRCQGAVVQACTRARLGQPTAWSIVLDCEAAGMVTCNEDGGPFRLPTRYCLNACGVRGTPLEATPCSRAPELPCAILICQPDGSLAPDHEACLAHGVSASRPEQCSSCYMEAGVCVGTAAATCLPPDNLTCHR